MSSQPEGPHLRSRGIGHLHLGDEDDPVSIEVEHVFAPEGSFDCDDCGSPGHDPGLVGLTMTDDEDMVTALLTPAAALMLANRLTRAASLVLESGEDVPDVEREAARFTTAAAE